MSRPRLRRAGSPGSEEGLPSVLVMTMARDEAELLPRWVRHYAAQVGMENLLVLDDNSVDGSTDGLACTVHRLPPFSGGSFEQPRMHLFSGLAAGFLAVYDFVVLADVDEFLVADPRKHRDLRSFLATRRDRDVIAPMALNVLHVPDLEGPLRDDRPVLDQRRFAKFAPIMCKPAIKQIPAAWGMASHAIEAPFEIDRELYMLHLKFADRDLLRRVAARRRSLVTADGRARHSSWSREADEMVAILDEAVSGVDPERVPEFDPRGVKLRRLVRENDGWYRSTGRGQVEALQLQPLRRVPSALVGTI